MIDTLHVALLTLAYYYYTVTNFGDYFALERDVWLVVPRVLLSS